MDIKVFYCFTSKLTDEVLRLFLSEQTDVEVDVLAKDSEEMSFVRLHIFELKLTYSIMSLYTGLGMVRERPKSQSFI